MANIEREEKQPTLARYQTRSQGRKGNDSTKHSTNLSRDMTQLEGFFNKEATEIKQN
jgi:hypothetical protein